MRKRLTLFVLAGAAICLLAVGLVACTGAAAGQYDGRYNLSKVTAGSVELSGDQLSAADQSLAKEKNYIEVKDSKNISFVLQGATPVNTTYTVEGNTMHVKETTGAAQTIDFVISGNELSYSMAESGTTVVLHFTKQS
ncbi:MAG: hypothetical protein FWF71_00940 [Actinomycetia bacterium]|nr:hypothetical protein [Actinomycetes bacterium]